MVRMKDEDKDVLVLRLSVTVEIETLLSRFTLGLAVCLFSKVQEVMGRKIGGGGGVESFKFLNEWRGARCAETDGSRGALPGSPAETTQQILN